MKKVRERGEGWKRENGTQGEREKGESRRWISESVKM